MDIEQRIKEAEQKFEQFTKDRDGHLKAAEDILTEMTKLQGEWRVLQDLLPKDGKKVNKKPTVIDAVSEEK